MALNELRGLIHPPPHPIEIGTASRLETIQDDLGIVYPDDYRDYCMIYGSGAFRDESIAIVVFNPCAARYLERVHDVCRWMREMREKRPDVVPFDAFPTRPGLFPWGWDVNGNDLFWFTDGDPNRWPVIARAEGYEFQRLEMPMTSFLAKSMKREIECILWMEQGFFPDPNRNVFEPERLPGI